MTGTIYKPAKHEKAARKRQRTQRRDEYIAELERELAEANRRIGYLLRVSGLGRIEAVDELIRQEAGEVDGEWR